MKKYIIALAALAFGMVSCVKDEVYVAPEEEPAAPVYDAKVVINEIDCGNKLIELYNTENKETDISGYILKKDSDTWTIPAGKGKIGSTLRGIGPTYTDKAARLGLRVGDILEPDFEERWNKLKNRHLDIFKQLGYEYSPEADDAAYREAVDYLRSFRLINSEYFVNNWLDEKPMLAEGAQGTLLDIDHGSYPFVTSSNTTAGGACTGLGVAPGRVGRVYGIFKAYCTRVGSGPFPTELFDETGEKIRRTGHEFGAVTGRPRRTGWLDLVALKYAVTINGVTDLVMMKADCLDDFETIKVCTAYKVGGEVTKEMPSETGAAIEPVYTEFKGWNTDLCGVTDESVLPKPFMDYVAFLEGELGVPIRMISLGPDRETIIER